MPKKPAQPTTPPPMQIRLPAELRARVSRIAEANNISDVDVIRLCLTQAVPEIEVRGITIQPAKPIAA